VTYTAGCSDMVGKSDNEEPPEAGTVTPTGAPPQTDVPTVTPGTPTETPTATPNQR